VNSQSLKPQSAEPVTGAGSVPQRSIEPAPSVQRDETVGSSDSLDRAIAASSDVVRRDLSLQLVDPSVSRAKFDREVRNYRAMESEYLRRGWILLQATFPQVAVLFAAPQIVPTPIILGVIVDFTNYDFWAASVRFVHPFTLAPLSLGEMPTAFWKRNAPPLLQSHQDQVPFLCVRGVREYHNHPAHSNDPWLAYRGTGVGTLYQILDILHRHGIAPLTGFGFQVTSMQVQIGLGPPDPTKVPE